MYEGYIRLLIDRKVKMSLNVQKDKQARLYVQCYWSLMHSVNSPVPLCTV